MLLGRIILGFVAAAFMVAPGMAWWVRGLAGLLIIGLVLAQFADILTWWRSIMPPADAPAGTGNSRRRLPPPAKGVRVLIRYRDRRGRRSDRMISVQEIKGDVNANGTLILHTLEAYCYDRQAFRTFHVNGIEQAADPDTGEVIADFPTHIARAFGQAHDVVRTGPPPEKAHA